MNIVKNYALGYLFLLPVFLYACEYLDLSWKARATKAGIVMIAGLSAFVVAVIQNTEDKEAISRNNDLLNQATRILEPIANLSLSACIEVDLNQPQMKEVADKLAALAQSRQDLSDSGGNNGLRPALFIDNLSDIFAPKMGTPAEGQTSGNITAAESALSLQTFTASFFKSEKPTDQISTLSNDLNKNSDLTAKFFLNTGISYANQLRQTPL
jgi:hypothetical protein